MSDFEPGSCDAPFSDPPETPRAPSFAMPSMHGDPFTRRETRMIQAAWEHTKQTSGALFGTLEDTIMVKEPERLGNDQTRHNIVFSVIQTGPSVLEVRGTLRETTLTVDRKII